LRQERCFICGPSSSQKSLANEQSAFFNELQSAYAANFGEQQAILSNLTNTLSPILNAGPNQMGFSAEEAAALQGKAINSTAAQARNAEVVAQSNAGGNTGVTTGGQQQLTAEIASKAGTNLSSEENQINLENAQLGRQNFFNAETGLANVAGLENPLGYAGATTNAGGQAFNEATQVQNMKNQEEAGIGGAISGLAGSFLDFANNSDTLSGLGGGKIFGSGGFFG
jgi:hypothetical protein